MTVKGTTYKRCTCTQPCTKKQLGTQCSKRKRANGMWSSSHGSWSFQTELPKGHNGSHRTRRRHGFASQTDAAQSLACGVHGRLSSEGATDCRSCRLCSSWLHLSMFPTVVAPSVVSPHLNVMYATNR